MDLHEHIEINQASAEAIARGLFAVAKSDGAHERELALIASFWSDTGGGAKSLAELGRRDAIAPEQLAAALHSSEERALFMKTALLLAYADGNVSAAERKTIAGFATALKVDQKQLEGFESGVKEFLLRQLSGLRNTDATSAIAGKLKL